MSRFSVILLVSGVCLALPTASCTKHQPASGIESMLPIPGFAEGWNSSGGVETFDETTLSDHINGEAAMYYPYGFTVAASATYTRAGATDNSVRADVYEMGSVLDAFGIYSNYRYADEPVPEFGCDGSYNKYQLTFYQDKYFVRLNALGDWGSNEETLLDCGRAIADRLPQPARPPAELDMLEFDGIEPRTEIYLAESVLGYSFFPKGFTADATLDGQPARVFVVFTSTEPDAEQSMQQYLDYLEDNEAEPEWITAGGNRYLTVQDPLHKGTIVHQHDAYILGATNLANPTQGTILLDRLRARLTPGS